jgi:hypothetical protein
MALLSCRIKKYGIPKALYCGDKNACVTNREPATEEQLAGEEPQSRFGKARGKLNIKAITARGPRGGPKGTALFAGTGSQRSWGSPAYQRQKRQPDSFPKRVFQNRRQVAVNEIFMQNDFFCFFFGFD